MFVDILDNANGLLKYTLSIVQSDPYFELLKLHLIHKTVHGFPTSMNAS